jgi:hypothetical protein
MSLRYAARVVPVGVHRRRLQGGFYVTGLNPDRRRPGRRQTSMQPLR